MGELTEYFKSRYTKEKNYSEDQILKTRIKNTISDLCQENLKEVGSIFTFEVLPKDLSYAIMVIDEEPIKSKYDIVQVSKTLFQAMLREVDI